MSPHRSNRKGDLGNYRPESSAADIDNIFFTEEGWVYRHFKGDPREANTRFWDEIIVAGQVDLDDTENGDPLKTLSETPRHYLGLGSIDESNSVDGYDADGIGYATADIDFEEVSLPTGSTRVIGITDKIFDVEYPKPNEGGGSGPDGGGSGPDGGCNNDSDCAPGEICVNGKCEKVPDPIGGCNNDLDCAPGEICVNGKCEKVPDPILIDEVVVSALSGAAGTSPDLGEIHEYKFSITGNATDVQGIMRIDPPSAGNVTDNKVEWTQDVDAKVIFDVTSATADDSPQSGDLEVNVKTPSVEVEKSIGNVTITGPTDVIKGMVYEYTVSFDGDADEDKCYVTNTTGVLGNITGDDTSLGVYIWKGTIGIGTTDDDFELKLTVQSTEDVQEDDNNSEGTLQLNASDPAATVSKIQYEWSNLFKTIPDGEYMKFSANPSDNRNDNGTIISGNYVKVTFVGESQGYGTPQLEYEGDFPNDIKTVVFDKNVGNYDYWKVDLKANGVGIRKSINVTAGGKSTGKSNDYLEVANIVKSPQNPKSIVIGGDAVRYEGDHWPGRGKKPYSSLSVYDNYPTVNDRDISLGRLSHDGGGAIYTIKSMKAANYVGFRHSQSSSNILMSSYQSADNDTALDPLSSENEDGLASFFLKLDNYTDVLPLSDMSVTLEINPLYDSTKQDHTGFPMEQEVIILKPDLEMFDPDIDYDEDGQEILTVSPTEMYITYDEDTKVYSSNFNLWTHSSSGEYAAQKDKLKLNIQVEAANTNLNFKEIDYDNHEYGPVLIFESDFLPTTDTGTIEVQFSYESAQGRITREFTLDMTKNNLEYLNDDGTGEAYIQHTFEGLDYPQWYKDYLAAI